jgi:type I restriction enzyme S subunit
LSQIAVVSAGDPAPQTKDDFAPDGEPFVRMQDVGRYGHTDNLTETADRISAPAALNLKRFPKGSILVPKSGASIRLNHRAILGVDAFVVSHLAVIIPKAVINGRFLYYWLCSVDLSKVAHETDFPSLRLMDLQRVEVPCPPLSEQERIVGLLDEADQLRRLRAEAVRRTADLVPALYYEMFGDPATNPKGWPISRAGDLMICCDYGSSERANDESKGTPIIRMNNVTSDGNLDITDLKYVQTDHLDKYRLQAGDVLFNRTNSRELVGKTGLWDGRFEAVPASYFIRVRFDSQKEHPQHFTTFMNLPLMKRRLFEMARSAIGQANINMKELQSIEIPVPPITLQIAFAARVAEIRAFEAAQTASRRRLDDLFQSSLHRAFHGEL